MKNIQQRWLGKSFMIRAILLLLCTSLILSGCSSQNNTPVFGAPSEPESVGIESIGDSVPIPIVLYHRILQENHPDLGSQAVTLKTLEDDINYMLERGYTPMQFKDIVSYVNDEAVLPEKPIVITFDDGYYNNYLYAYPLLKEKNVKASLAVIGDRIDAQEKRDTYDDNFGYCNWAQIKEMQVSEVFEITSHTYGMHYDKPRNGVARMEKETDEEYVKAISKDLEKQKAVMKEQLDIDVAILSYPYGIPVDVTTENSTPVNDVGAKAIQKQGIELTCVVGSKGVNKVNIGDKRSLYGLQRYNRVYGKTSVDFFDPIFALCE